MSTREGWINLQIWELNQRKCKLQKWDILHGKWNQSIQIQDMWNRNVFCRGIKWFKRGAEKEATIEGQRDQKMGIGL